jgi:hypothetical protein
LSRGKCEKEEKAREKRGRDAREMRDTGEGEASERRDRRSGGLEGSETATMRDCRATADSSAHGERRSASEWQGFLSARPTTERLGMA